MVFCVEFSPIGQKDLSVKFATVIWSISLSIYVCGGVCLRERERERERGRERERKRDIYIYIVYIYVFPYFYRFVFL